LLAAASTSMGITSVLVIFGARDREGGVNCGQKKGVGLGGTCGKAGFVDRGVDQKNDDPLGNIGVGVLVESLSFLMA
jgi:hypothetical protein